MVNGFKIITLCGSTRFKDEFLEAQKRLTLEGNVVISVGLFGHSGDNEVWTEGVKDMLDRQHLAKIDLADEIFVVNVGGYIGDSTRREIVYAEFKGKSITYLERCRKPNIYDNYAALSELHDAGRISDEDYEKAGHDFDEKRKVAVAEYYACKGPWPYQWENIDAVVCGLLQQHTIASIDYHDVKYLYEADGVYEIRIKGKGINAEKQIQGIIDTIRKEYMNLPQSSKKIVVTLSCSSNPTPYLERIADCLDVNDIVWQTRILPVEEEMELSIVTNETKKMNNETIKQLYDDWVSRVSAFLFEESSKYSITCGTFQSKPILDKQPDVVFLGYNPHETGGIKTLQEIQQRFYEGNPYFYSDERMKWSIWKPLREFFEWADYTRPVEDGNFVFFNAIYFGTNKIIDFRNLQGSNDVIKKCLQFTGEVIHNIFKPKCIVCLSVPDCFDNLNRQFKFAKVKRINTLQETDAGLIDFAMNKEAKGWKIRYNCKRIIKKGFWEDIPVYGIPHPSGSVSNDDFSAITLYLRSEMQKLGI